MSDDPRGRGAAAAAQNPEPGPGGSAPEAELPDDIADLLGAPRAGRESPLADVQGFFTALDKAVKMLTFYEGRGKNCESAVAEALAALQGVLEDRPQLTVRVSPYEFLLDGEPVYISDEERKGMTYRIFRDGIREVTFVPGMEAEEFRQILDLLRQGTPGSAEDNLVTALWERDGGHLRFRAIELFQEGLTDSDMGGSGERIGSVAEGLNAPLHGPTLPKVLPALRKKPDPQKVKLARAQAEKVDALLDRADPAATRAALQPRLEAMQTDVWRRAIQVASRMAGLEQGASNISEVLGTVLEEMLRAGDWALFNETLQSVQGVLSRGKGEEALQSVLARVNSPATLAALGPRLETAGAEELAQLEPLLRLLPKSADPHLVRLLVGLPEGESHRRLQELLGERGVDLTDLHIRRLKSGNPEVLEAALTELAAIGSTRAMSAVATVLGHPIARVRVQALRLLEGHQLDPRIARKVVPDLIPSLASGHAELRDLCFGVLEGVDHGPYGGDLALFLKDQPLEQWEARPRQRALALAVRWGGKAADEFLVKQICGGSLFHRKRSELLRGEILEVLRRSGGPRAQKLLGDCLAARPSRALRAELEALQKEVE